MPEAQIVPHFPNPLFFFLSFPFPWFTRTKDARAGTTTIAHGLSSASSAAAAATAFSCLKSKNNPSSTAIRPLSKMASSSSSSSSSSSAAKAFFPSSSSSAAPLPPPPPPPRGSCIPLDRRTRAAAAPVGGRSSSPRFQNDSPSTASGPFSHARIFLKSHARLLHRFWHCIAPRSTPRHQQYDVTAAHFSFDTATAACAAIRWPRCRPGPPPPASPGSTPRSLLGVQCRHAVPCWTDWPNFLSPARYGYSVVSCQVWPSSYQAVLAHRRHNSVPISSQIYERREQEIGSGRRKQEIGRREQE